MSYLGSKGQAGVFQRIIGNMPPHSFYVEAFLGSGKIFLTKRPAVHNVGIDADSGAIASFNAAGLDAQIICGDALKILPALMPTLPADAVVYCDPPYLLATRTSHHRYRHEPEAGDPDWHVKFLTLVDALKCRVMISGYPSKLYEEMLRNWRCCTYRTRTRGRTRTECLWCNFPEPTELHDWRFAGRNFRQRLAMKRQATRWLARLDAMPPLKRGYVLDLVHQRYNRRGRPVLNAESGVPR